VNRIYNLFYRPAGVSRWRIVDLLERSGQESKQIGCVELDSDHLLFISRNQINSTALSHSEYHKLLKFVAEFAQELVTTGDTLLEIIATCVSLPPDKSDSWTAHSEG
jgi:hypothetical protein